MYVNIHLSFYKMFYYIKQKMLFKSVSYGRLSCRCYKAWPSYRTIVERQLAVNYLLIVLLCVYASLCVCVCVLRLGWEEGHTC